MTRRSGKNGHAVLQAVLAEEYALHSADVEPATGHSCDYAGCPRPGHPHDNGYACLYHAGREPARAVPRPWTGRR